jgi:hypothetical protein
VVLSAKAVERRIYTLETSDVAFFGSGEACNSLEDLKGGLLIAERDALSHSRRVRPARAFAPSFPSPPY